MIDCKYTKFVENMTVKKYGEVFKTFTLQSTEWMNEEGRVVNRIDLKPITKVWVKFLESRLISTTHTTTISQDRLKLLYSIVKGLAINIREIIEKEIRKSATKKQKCTTLLFPSLITGICETSGVKFEASDERVKNEGVITTKTIKIITMESTAAASQNTML